MRTYRIRKFPTKIFILVLIIIILSLSSGLRTKLKVFTFELLGRPLGLFSGLSSRLTKMGDLSTENLSLKQKIASLSVELARMERLARQNERLRDTLDFSKSLPYKTILAQVVGRDSIDWRKSVIINKGKNDGIKERMPCATDKGVVGSVAEVGKDTSKVMLITDPASKVAVVVEPSRESGILVGSIQAECKVIYLSLDAEINKGDKILTAGFSALFPKGLPVGEVVEVGIDKTRLYKYVLISTFSDMNRLEEVVCIKTQK